jgi:hypothetical protein
MARYPRRYYRKDREDWPTDHEIKLANGQTMKVHPCVHKNHSFFWDTSLTYKRMCEISDWLETLDADHRQMLDELFSDRESEAHFNSSEDA